MAEHFGLDLPECRRRRGAARGDELARVTPLAARFGVGQVLSATMAVSPAAMACTEVPSL
jgi:hypothetical protein